MNLAAVQRWWDNLEPEDFMPEDTTDYEGIKNMMEDLKKEVYEKMMYDISHDIYDDFMSGFVAALVEQEQWALEIAHKRGFTEAHQIALSNDEERQKLLFNGEWI